MSYTKPIEPTDDEITLRTWRGESEDTVFARYFRYSYPTRGLHGAPLYGADAPDRKDIP
jgi:hypothetical protein